MKKSILLWMFALLMMAVGMSGCSSDDDSGDYDKDLVRKWANTEPAFTYEDFMAISSDSEETTNGTWIVKKANGIL